MNDEQLLIQLRDCFTGGYTLPQFCIDNKIRKPLFVAEAKFWQFFWEIYVQFRYDKRLSAQFAFIDAPSGQINLSAYSILSPLTCRNISEVNPAECDAIICLTAKKIFAQKGIIYLDALTDYFIRRTYAEIPLLNFLQRFPKIKLFLTKLPNKVRRYEGSEEFAKTLTFCGTVKDKILASAGKIIPTKLDKFSYTNQEFVELVSMHGRVVTNLDGSTVMEDRVHPLVRVKNGKRETAYQPEKYLNRIFFLGPCHYVGALAPFDKTIESYLQQMLNEKNLPYRVENEGQGYVSRYQDMFYNLNKLHMQEGDIIFINFLDGLVSSTVPSVDLSDAFDPPYDYREIFVDGSHFNELGYKILAEKFFAFLTANNFFRDVDFNYPTPPPQRHRYGIPPQFESGGKNFSNLELEAFKQKLRASRPKIGALVMNCNPFTLGHLHLVEYAAAQVLKLYIFVVEEDRSEFPFADRIELVRTGVKNFSNVEVLPSGKFIISQQTFSGYFNKSELQDVQVDSSRDVEIFAKEITPTLGITIRFAGEEPQDNVTRQYNETMKNILPRHGIEFREIPRKTFGDEVISASTVREALKRGDFDKIKNLVPDTTLLYLRGRHAVAR